MAENRITIYQGNSDTVFVSVLDSSSLQMDLTNYAGTLTVKKKLRDATPTLSYNNATVNNSEGAMTFEILAADTSIASGDYNYDIIVANASTNKIYTVVQDLFQIIDSVKY